MGVPVSLPGVAGRDGSIPAGRTPVVPVQPLSDIPPYPGTPTTPAAKLSVATASNINKTAKKASVQQFTVAALDALVVIPYGIVRPTVQLGNALFYNGNWVFWCIWGLGPVTSIDSISLNDAPLPTGVTVTHYTGADGQGVDPTLRAAFAQAGGFPAYNETLPGLAYSVIVAPAKMISGSPAFNVIMHGRKLYDPRQDSTNGGTGAQRFTDPTTWAFSRNPTLVLVDFLTSTVYGDSKTPDWPSVIANANANDVMLGTSPNIEVARLCDHLIDTSATTRDWLEALRTAACCWIVPTGDVVKLMPDITGTSSASYSHAAGNLISVENDTLRDTRQLPTVVEIQYTDTSQLPWRDAYIQAKRPGVDAGTTPWRKSQIQMPWIKRSTQAYREAVERINKLWLRAATMDVQVMDEGLIQEVGDIITLTYPDGGYSNLLLRVVQVTQTAVGWMLSCEKEDAQAYSTQVQSGQGSSPTNLPLATNPPLPTTLALAEELYQLDTGQICSRLRATWDPVGLTYPFFIGYRIEVYVGTLLIDSTTVQNNTYATPQVQEGLTYTINVSTLSSVTASAVATASATAQGKLLKPSDVPYFFCYETAGAFNAQWIPSVDLDIASHEIRYGPVLTANWANATVVDFIPTPARTYTTRTIPPGNYAFFIKGHDSIRTALYPNGQESVNAKQFNLNIGGDPDLFIANRYSFTAPTLTNMVAEVLGGATAYLTDYGGVFGTVFTSNLGTYTNALATYSGSGTSTLLTEAFDFGQLYSGLMISTLVYTDLAGTAAAYIETSPDGTTWTQYAGLSAQVNARFVRVRVTTTGTVLVTSLGYVQLSVTALTETGQVTTNASGPVTVTLSRLYTKVKSIQLTADVTAGQRNPGFSNVQIGSNPRFIETNYFPEDFVDETTPPANTFDVYCWDGLNNQVAAPVQYLFSGI